jgi:Na+-driven multidrug efflux pump
VHKTYIVIAIAIATNLIVTLFLVQQRNRTISPAARRLLWIGLLAGIAVLSAALITSRM